jgi:PhnB protein
MKGTPEMKLNPNLVFSGIAESVLEHYRDALGGDVEIMRFADSPAAGSVEPAWANKVIYGTLRSPAGNLNVMDAPPGRAGTPGSNFVLGIETESRAQVDQIFSKLSASGAVTMPLDKTFWSPRFGMLTDKFGIKWMINLCEPPSGHE